MEKRLDGSLAVRNGERYLPVSECVVAEKRKPAAPAKAAPARRAGKRGSDWDKHFEFGKGKGPKVWQAARESRYRKAEDTI